MLFPFGARQHLNSTITTQIKQKKENREKEEKDRKNCPTQNHRVAVYSQTQPNTNMTQSDYCSSRMLNHTYTVIHNFRMDCFSLHFYGLSLWQHSPNSEAHSILSA